MTVSTLDSRTPFVITLSVPATVVDGEVQLTEANFVPVGTGAVQTVFGRTGAVVAVAGDYAASDITNDSGVAGADVAAALDTLDGGIITIPALNGVASIPATTAGALYIAVPTDYSGAITKVRAVTNGDPGGNVLCTTAIGTSGGAYSAVTNGGFTVANGATAGTASVATPTAANTVVGGTSIIRIAWDNGAASAVVCGLTIEITRS